MQRWIPHLPPTQHLLLTIVDGDFAALPQDVKYWFGLMQGNRVLVTAPSREKCTGLLEHVERAGHLCVRAPNLYADGRERKKHIFESLPLAPPPKRSTGAKLATQEGNNPEDDYHIEGLTWTHIGGLGEGFTKRVAVSCYLVNFPTLA